MFKSFLSLLGFLLLWPLHHYAQTRYWVSDVAANWSGNNWANNSNGAPDGGGPPTNSQIARFDVNGTGACTLDVAVDTVAGLFLVNYPAIFEMNGNALLSTGNSTMNNGTINDQTGNSVLRFEGSSTVTVNNGAVLNVRTEMSVNDIEMDGGHFGGVCVLEKTGTSNDYGSGGNYFGDSLLFTHSAASGYFLLGGTSPDTFDGFVSVNITSGGHVHLSYGATGNIFNESIEFQNNSGTGIYIGNNNGRSTMAAGKTILIGSGGISTGAFNIRGITQAGSAAVSLTCTGSTDIFIRDCDFGGPVTISSPGVTTAFTTYRSAVSITKTGAASDGSAGGNRFMDNTTLTNNSAGYFLMGNGSPDTFDLDLTMVNTGSNYMYLAYNSAGNVIGGDLMVTNSGTGAGNMYVQLSALAGTTLDIGGDVTLVNNGNGDDIRIYVGNAGSVTIAGDAYLSNEGTGTNGYIMVADNATSTVDFGGVVRVINTQAGNVRNIYFGNQGSITVQDSLYLLNSSSASTSYIYCNHNTNSVNTYNGDIVVENSNAAGDGVVFGNANGTGTLAAGQQLVIGANGFVTGLLELRNFTQVGATAQALTLANDASLNIRTSSFGGNIDFDAPTFIVRESDFAGTFDVRRSGTTSDWNAGGNHVSGAATITTTASGYWLWGATYPDTFLTGLTIIDSSASNFYLGYNSAGTYVDGDLVIEKYCTGTNTYMQVADQNGSTVEVSGNILATSNSSSSNDRFILGNAGNLTVAGDVTVDLFATSASNYVIVGDNTSSLVDIGGSLSTNIDDNGTLKQVYVGNNGTVIIGGELLLDNQSTIDQSDVYIGNAANASVTVQGVCRATNDGAGTTRRIYLGNSGDVTFNDSLLIYNASTATNSFVFLDQDANSQVTYNGHIVLEAPSNLCDGVYFGNGNGTGTLAATRTITIGPAGYTAQNLYIRNFTQVGATPQSLHPTDTTYMFCYNSNWGGDVDFSAPRYYTYGTTYSGTTTIEKTGAVNDASPGLNFFAGETSLLNSGSGYLLMGNGNPDTFMLDVTMENTGASSMYLAYSTDTSYVGGDLYCYQQGTGVNATMILSNGNNTHLEIAGNVFFENTATISNSSSMYIGNAGTVAIGGDVQLINDCDATTSTAYIGNTSSSGVSVGGSLYVENSSMNGSNSEMYVGNNAPVTVGDTLWLLNHSNANSNRIYCNNQPVSISTYNGDIIVESTHADGDGISFGQSGGSSTLVAGQTVTVGAGGYVAGALYFYNFTQVGPTAQSILATGTADMYIRDSHWGGNIDFTAPRMRTLLTQYDGTASLEKSGSVDDESYGGNYFASDVVLTCSGDGYFRMSVTEADSFMTNLDLNLTGSRHLYVAHNAPDCYVGGDITAVNTATASTAYLAVCSGNSASLQVDGNVDMTSNASATTAHLYLASGGATTIDGNLTVDVTGNANNSQFFMASSSLSSVDVGGVTRISSSGSGNSCFFTIGDNGDVTFADSVYLLNSSSATNNEYRIAWDDFSHVQFNGDVVIECTDAAGSGMRFGASAGTSTLADGQRIVIGPGGFVSGNLHLYYFHQEGTTSQSLITTGTTYVYGYQNTWEGDLEISGARNRTEQCRYEGALVFSKTGAGDDDCSGGNYVGGNAELINSGSARLRFATSQADTFMLDLDLDNSGSSGIVIAQNSANNFIGGNLTGTSTGTGSSTYLYASEGGNSTLQVDGDVYLENTASSTTSQIQLAVSGDITIGGRMTLINDPVSTNSYVQVATNSGSSADIAGVARLELGSGSSNNGYSYLGYNGSINFGDSLYLLNASGASNAFISCNQQPLSTNTYAGDIVVSASHASSDGIQFGSGGGAGTLAAGQTVTVGDDGFVAGTLYFRNFTQVGPTDQALTLTGTATMNNYDASWGGNVVFISPRFYTYRTLYSGTAYFEKTGTGDDASSGGNTITGDFDMINSGGGYFMMGNSLPDSCLANIEMVNQGTHSIYFANNSLGNYVAGDINVSNSATGGSTYVMFNSGTNSSLQIDGSLTIDQNATSSNPRIYLGDNGDITLNGDLSVFNTPASSQGYVFLANGTNSSMSIGGVARFEHDATGTTHHMYLGNNGDVTFQDSLYVLNNSTATNNTIFLNSSGNSQNVYNGDIVITSENASADGIQFGNSNGQGTLASGQAIVIGDDGFIAGTLYLRNFFQVGVTPQSLTVTNDANINLYASTFDADLSLTAPRLYTSYSTYDGVTVMEKNGAGNDQSTGGNTFNDDFSLLVTGTGYMMLPNNVADDYNGDVTYLRSSTGTIHPSYSVASTYAGDIHFDLNTAITLAGNSGTIVMDGTGPQVIDDLGSSPQPTFRRLQLNKASDTVTLEMPIYIGTSMTFTSGHMHSDSINVLTFTDNSTAIGPSHTSFVYGPVEKVGNDTFRFPIGDSLYRPIRISNPASGSAVFRAVYCGNSPEDTYDKDAVSAPINHVSRSEYWTLERRATTNSVFVTLTWDANSGGVDNLSDLLVAHWSGGQWISEGNGGTTGDTLKGTVISSSALSSFSPLTLGSTTLNNPLPVELLAFDATVKDQHVALNWTTATEINNDYFAVERSDDGKVFSEIGRLPGAGTTTDVQQYSFLDFDPLPGTSYYRLRQIDHDGSADYSPVRSVRFESNGNEVKVWDAQTHVQIALNGEADEVFKVTVYDMRGALVLQTNARISQGTPLRLPRDFARTAGYYQFVLEGQTLTFSERIFLP